MILDARGLELSESDRDAVDAINVFTARLLRLENGVEVIVKAGEEHPESPMTMLLCGAFHLFAQTKGGNASAAGWLGKFKPAASNDRGRMLHGALMAWHDGEYLSAVEGMEAITGRWPSDLLTAKFAEFLYYVLGQQHMGARFRAHMDRIADAHPDDTDFLGMRAFSEELCGDFAAAEKSAVHALKLEERNAWAQHALSHVLIRMGRIGEGRARLQAFLPELPGFQRLIHSHDAWHLALLHIEELDSAAALDVYRNHVWGFAPDLVGEQIDAISLLWRLELAGFEVDAEWADVAAHSAPRAGETFMPFLSAHHLYAFVRAGENEAHCRASGV